MKFMSPRGKYVPKVTKGVLYTDSKGKQLGYGKKGIIFTDKKGKELKPTGFIPYTSGKKSKVQHFGASLMKAINKYKKNSYKLK